MVESVHPIKLMLNVAVALVLAFLMICSTILSILFGQLLLPPVGGFIILVVGTYLYLRSSSARFYLRPDIAIHITLLCSYLLIAFPVWLIKVQRISPGLPAIFDIILLMTGVIVIMGSGIILLATGLILLFIQAKNVK